MEKANQGRRDPGRMLECVWGVCRGITREKRRESSHVVKTCASKALLLMSERHSLARQQGGE